MRPYTSGLRIPDQHRRHLLARQFVYLKGILVAQVDLLTDSLPDHTDKAGCLLDPDHLRIVLAFVAASPAPAQIDAQAKNAVVSAKVTSVETNLGGNGWHYLTTTVHLQNLTRQPLILGVESGKVTSTDDRGNTYGVLSVRGIGQIAGAKVDTKFVLPAEGGGDALFQMRWRGDRNAVFGTVFDLKLPLRVIVPLEAGQFKLGMEHLLTFTGLKAGYVATLKTVSAIRSMRVPLRSR